MKFRERNAFGSTDSQAIAVARWRRHQPSGRASSAFFSPLAFSVERFFSIFDRKMVIGGEAKTTDIRSLKDGKRIAANCALMRQLGKKRKRLTDMPATHTHTQWKNKDEQHDVMNKMRTNYTIRVSVTIYSTSCAVTAASHHTPQSELSSRNA